MQVWSIAPSMLNQKTRGNYPGQQNALAAIYEGSQVDFDTADRIETRYFAKTAAGQIAKNMIGTLWFQLNAIKKGGSRPEGFEQTRFSKIGILGAGMMGAGIAYVTARAGFDVVLKDVDQERALKGKGYTEKLLHKQRAKGRVSDEKMQAILGRITATGATADLEGCDLIIEAVFEDRELKAKVTRETEAVIAPASVFASNTSTLPITGLAERASRPQNFIGLHFFSPVDKMQLVEIIIGEQTSAETLARAFDFVLQIRKTPIVVNDSRGFYTSRVFSTYVMEGVTMLQEGIHPRLIESAGLQAGMPVGPLALSDEVSISLMYHIMTQTRKDMAAAGVRHEGHPGDAVVVKMIEELERPGKKDGRGFYDYPADEAKHLWPGLQDIYPPAETQPARAELVDRMLFAQAIETVRCLDEGVLTSVADANLGSIFGWGFPPFHGGCLQFINAYGHDAFVKRANSLADQHGERFRPSQSLIDRAARNQAFT
jgi:3-hydroxyacyl-CoA dehydrogenase/enoyl-CoA hydratase/3-hydroxybutyryl-CoA epimerase